MDFYLEQRIIDEANYIVETGATVRKTAKVFNLGKSTVHKDVSVLLKSIDYNLYLQVYAVLQKNTIVASNILTWENEQEKLIELYKSL